MLISLVAKPQGGGPFEELLKGVREVELSDSLHINIKSDQLYRMDSLAVKKWFFPLLGSISNNRLKNRSYYLTSKMTSNPKFNILAILEQKKKSDTISSQVVYLVTTKKDGTYIASIKAAIAGNKKRSSYNSTAWIYKDYKVVLDSKMIINEKEYADMSNYRINGTGRFILYPNY